MGGIVSAVYGAKIMKGLNLLNDKFQVLVTGTVQEETVTVFVQYIVNEDKVRPEFCIYRTDRRRYLPRTRGLYGDPRYIKGFPARVPLRNAVTTPSTKWLTFFRMYAH